MSAATVEREIRIVRVCEVRVPLGVLAGNAKAHSFVPDHGNGTSCQLCFGWSDDTRHLGHRAVVAS